MTWSISSILDEIARRYQAFGKMCTVYAYEKEQGFVSRSHAIF